MPLREATPVIAVAAAIVAIVVLFSVGAYYASLPPIPSRSNLTLNLLQPEFHGTAATVAVGYVSTPISPRYLLVNLAVNGTEGTAVPMPATSGIGSGPVVNPAGYPFRIDWSDVDGDGRVSTGDVFTISPITAWPPCCAYETFIILWQPDGSLVAQLSFYGAPVLPPAVLLGAVSRGSPTNVYVPVQNVAPPTAPSHFQVQLRVDANWSGVVSLPLPGWPVVNLSVGGGEYVVAWYDNDYDGLVDAGDAFNITLGTGTWPLANTSMAFFLEWWDGTILAVATWSA